MIPILQVPVPLGIVISILLFAGVVGYLWGRRRGIAIERQHAREVRERLRQAQKIDPRTHAAPNEDLPESRVSRGDFRSGYWKNDME